METGGKPVIVPTPVPLSTIPVAGVFADTSFNFYMKLSDTSAVELSNAQIFNGLSPTQTNYYFPGAALVIQ